jgi:hypothetical protein
LDGLSIPNHTISSKDTTDVGQFGLPAIIEHKSCFFGIIQFTSFEWIFLQNQKAETTSEE